MRPVRLRSQAAFSLVEVLVSVVLLAVGLVATLKALGSLSQAQTRAQEFEDMQRLGLRKYDEIVSLGTLTSGTSSGDFQDLGENRFIWTAERTPSGVKNLDIIRVDVARRWEGFGHSVELQGLLCAPATKGGNGS